MIQVYLKCLHLKVFFGATNHQNEVHITTLLLISQFKGTQRVIPLYNPFSDYINQTQKDSIATNQSARSSDHTFMLITITITVRAL